MNDSTQKNETPEENPFTLEDGTGTDPFLSPGHHTLSIFTGGLISIVAAVVGLFSLWNGFAVYAQIYLNVDPAKAMFSQLPLPELIILLALAAAVLGFSALMGIWAKNNVQTQIRKNMQQKQSRATLESKVAEMHRIVKEHKANAGGD